MTHLEEPEYEVFLDFLVFVSLVFFVELCLKRCYRCRFQRCGSDESAGRVTLVILGAPNTLAHSAKLRLVVKDAGALTVEQQRTTGLAER